VLTFSQWRVRWEPRYQWIGAAGGILAGAALVFGLSASRDEEVSRSALATVGQATQPVEGSAEPPVAAAPRSEGRGMLTRGPDVTAEDADTRIDTIFALSADGSESAAAALAAAALGDPDPSVREDAVLALGEIGGRIGRQTLTQALADPDINVQKAAVEAFADLGGGESARALTLALQDDDPELRAEAVDALADVGGDAAIELLRYAAKDEIPAVREAAEEYLAEMTR
jgi:HEAT repeats